jgi:NAD(P)H-hydrate epimerase
MMKYVSVAEMIAIEKESDASNHTYAQMMEFAGRGLAEIVRDAYSYIEDKKALGLVGSGNNGGDTLVAFCYLQEWGWQTTAYIVRPRPENDPLVSRFLASGGELLEIGEDPSYTKLIASLEKNSLLLDGILGTGIKLPLRGQISEVLIVVRNHLHKMDSALPVVAVDCPSGIDCDNGQAAPECLAAEITVTMACVKQGLLQFPAFNFVGDLRLVSIGLPDGLLTYQSIQREVVNFEWVRQILPNRPLDSHKGTFGTVLVIGGSQNYSGAVLLAGKAAFRSGAGWVTLAVPEILHTALAGQFIETTWLLLPHTGGFINAEADVVVHSNLGKPTAILIGPGLGLDLVTKEFVARLIADRENLPPFVFDADGLKLLAQIPEWWKKIPARTILTPHPGEMSILTRIPVNEIQSHRIEIAEKFAQEWGHIVVLKGAFSVIAEPEGKTAIIPVATPALARAGTGDVLAGLVVGLRGQGINAYDAAVAACWIHAQAGLLSADLLGSSATVLAGDVLSAVIDVFAEF